MLFETERLLIRRLELTDIEPFYEMQGNPNVMKYVGGKTNTLEECEKQLIDLTAEYDKEKKHLLVWAVTQKADVAFVGTCALVHYENGDNEIGYRFLEKYWGKGFGQEVSDGLVDYAIEELKVNNIVAYVDIRNKGSVKILEKSKLPFIKEYYNKDDDCIDRMYKWTK